MFSLLDVYNYIVKNFVFFAGLAAGLKWIWEYSQKRKFEKNKFLLERLEKFDDLETTKIIKKILDYNACYVETPQNPKELITDKIFIEAIVTHDKKSLYTPLEVWIKVQLDDYFDNLNELIMLSEYGLVDKKNLKKMLIYWIEILNGAKKVKDEQFSKNIKSYLEFYGFRDVLKFIT